MNEHNNIGAFFSGGGGFFIDYFDVVRPLYLFTVLDMIMNNLTFGLPVDIIKDMSCGAILEWYVKRRYVNPLKCLDFYNIINDKELDDCLDEYITRFPIYRLCPDMNIHKMMDVYRNERMEIPVFIYTEKEYDFVKEDIHLSFPSINKLYLHGDLNTALERCAPNFTYIFSSIDRLKIACDHLKGTCAHILLSNEYRYNQAKINQPIESELYNMMISTPYLRIGTTSSIDLESMLMNMNKLIYQGEE